GGGWEGGRWGGWGGRGPRQAWGGGRARGGGGGAEAAKAGSRPSVSADAGRQQDLAARPGDLHLARGQPVAGLEFVPGAVISYGDLRAAGQGLPDVRNDELVEVGERADAWVPSSAWRAAPARTAAGHYPGGCPPFVPGRCRSLTVKPSSLCLSATSMSSWCITHSPSPSRRSEVLPGAGTRPARRSAGPWPVS